MSRLLTGDVGLFFVFVDDPGAAPWQSEDREAVEGKIREARRWLEVQASLRGVALYIHTVSTTSSVSVPINEHDRAAGPHHSSWMNTAVSRIFDESLSVAGAETRMRALIRDVDSFSVLFVVRRRGCPSRAFPFTDQVDPEFACERAVIFDAGRDGQIYLGSLIAHEILHLYGADDLHTTEHESDLMHTPTQRPIDDYLASDLTASLVGWRGVACTMHVA